jgi:predicted HicB family RNase H-like nuclease
MREKLSKMLVVMLRPSMHESAEERAASKGLNVSEYIRALIEADLPKRKGK